MKNVKSFLLGFSFAALVFTAPGGAPAGVVVEDLSAVAGLERLNAPEPAKILLGQNGFVVVPRFYRQIFSPYIQENLPAFVTTDSLFHTFHVIFAEKIRKMEERFAGDAGVFTAEMLAETESMLAEEGLTEAERAALGRNLSFFSVAALLLDGGFIPAEAAGDAVNREAALINSASRVGKSPVFGYDIDYTRFKPRGFYAGSETLERYFRCMSWYGNAAFRLISESETLSAAFIARALSKNSRALGIWRRMDAKYTRLLAESDDLTPGEYIYILESAPPGSFHDAARFLREEAAGLRDPKINSMVIRPDGMPRWRELTKGMRVFGKRHIIDSEIFMYLTFPGVPGRGFPSGLDLMAAAGSTRAMELLREQGAADLPGFREGLEKAESAMADLRKREETSHYRCFLGLLDTLLGQEAGDGVFPFMRTEAYTDKNLSTSLGMWAAMRHTWQLAAKQSATYLGMRRPVPGWVEPNIPFYEKLGELIEKTIGILSPLEGVDTGRLRILARLTGDVRSIARKQAEGLELSTEEEDLLGSYGRVIANLSYFKGNSYLAESALPWMSLAADVHTEHLHGECLQVGIGPAMPIYVVIPRDGELYLAVGGVYSYYEFRQNIAERLTDEKWKTMTASGNLPPRPPWTSSFVSGYDAGDIMERLRRGERVEEAAYMEVPGMTEFLEEALRPGGVFERGDNMSWAAWLYGRKAGERAVPLLMALLREGDIEQGQGVARALSPVAGPGELPGLKEILLGGERNRLWAALRVVSSIGGGAAEDMLIDVFEETGDRFLRRVIVSSLGTGGSKSLTPFLIENFEGELRAGILQALSFIWGGVPWELPAGERSPGPLCESREESFRREAEELVLENILSEDERVARAAVEAAGNMKLADAVPIIAGVMGGEPGRLYAIEAVKALAGIGTDDSCRVLIELSYGAEDMFRIISAFAENRNPLAVPRLKELLEDQACMDGLRVCDFAAMCLSEFYPDFPAGGLEWPRNGIIYGRGPSPEELSEKKRDGIIESWKKFLGAGGAGGEDGPAGPEREPRRMSAYEVIEGGDRFVSRNFSDEGVPVLSRSYSMTTHKLHGEWKEYGPGGELVSTRWFVHGEEADEGAFLESERERLEKRRAIEEQYTEFDREEGARIDAFVGELAGAWKRGDHEFSRALIGRRLEKEPGWVPGVFARFGYLMAVDRDFEGALAELKRAWDLIGAVPEDDFRNPEIRRRLFFVIPRTIEFMESIMERGLMEEERLSAGRVFPGTEFSIMYAAARGYPVSPLRELAGGIGE